MQATEDRLDDATRAQLLDHAETLAARDGPLLGDRDAEAVARHVEAMRRVLDSS